MCKKEFVQIHCHSDGSLLDGCSSTDKLIKRAKELGHKALALTDHGGPQNIFTFYKEAKKQGIKPILGLEFYINNDLRSRFVNKDRELEQKDYHQSVYIKNKEGYINYNYMTYISFTDGYYYKPRIDFDLLFERKKGLMLTSSCMASKIGNYVRSNKHKDAEDLFKRYVKEFGDDFYGEIQFNEVEGQKEINNLIIHLCRKYGIKTLIGGDVHYLNPGDGALQDALIRSKRDNENSDWTISARHLYFHDSGDYFDFNKKFGFNYDEKLIEKCLENSVEFAEKPNFEFETGKYHLPKINTGEMSSKEYISKATWEGIVENIEIDRKYFPDKYNDEDIDKIEKQVEYELKIINDLGLNDYLLFVYDINKWCKEKGYYVGAGRGSAAGSIVCWALGITKLNPIEHGLKFERFINPERKVMADIDCLTENAMILLPSGVEKKISEIVIGDVVESERCTDVATVIAINKRKPKEGEKIYRIECYSAWIFVGTPTTIIELSENHIIPIYRNNKDRMEVRAFELLETDCLISNHMLSWKRWENPWRLSCKIKKIEEIKYEGDLYDISLDNDSKLFYTRTNNDSQQYLLVHNCDYATGVKDKILEYLIEKYGQESVCTVATFGTFGPKSALQAMSRGLKKDTAHESILMRKITKLEELQDKEGKKSQVKNLPEYFNNLEKTTHDSEILSWIKTNQDVIDFSNKILGQFTQIGCHAGGIVITPKPIYNYIPVTRGSGRLVSGFKEADGSSKDLSELGILKLDILGISTLNILQHCVENIKKDKGIDLYEKIYHLDLIDKNLIDYFYNGSNYGIFQMERGKMFTKEIKVDCFDDIVAINALNRPGPLEKYLKKYGYWKQIDKGEIEISEEELREINKERYPFPFMKPALEKTYGCLIYQEQFMDLVKEAADFDMGEADDFRRGIGWTKDNIKYFKVEKYFEKLKNGMIDKGYSQEDVDTFVKYCRDFLGYSFNLSHSFSYSYTCFQTLFFKHYYPAYFFAAMLNNENDIEKITEIIADAGQCGIKVLPHSITKSGYFTKVETDDSIRLGFAVIKGTGNAVEEQLGKMNLSQYKELHEILQADFGKINSTQLQNFIDLGAFDEFNVDREKITLMKDLYSNDSIKKWFTRTKQTLRLEVTPKVLSENFDKNECLKIALKVKSEKEPWKALTSELIKNMTVQELDKKKYNKITEKKQKELIGFVLSKTKLSDVASSLRAKSILPLSEFNDQWKEYYFLVDSIDFGFTSKSHKKYMKLVLYDGKKNIKAKCWGVIDLVENEVYYGKFKKDDYGFTLLDREVYSAL